MLQPKKQYKINIFLIVSWPSIRLHKLHFLMSKVGLRNVRREHEANSRERFEAAYTRYVQGQFTYDSHCLIQKLVEKSKKQTQMRKIPLYPILIEISKIMMFNELELLFFGATLEEMKWKVSDNTLTDYIENVNGPTDILNKDSACKKMELSLLLIAYTVKKYLNEEMHIFDYKIREIFKNSFDKMYQEWVAKVQTHFRFSPKSMNGMFREMDVVKKQKEQQIINYNQRVDTLFKTTDEEPHLQCAKRQQPMEGVPVKEDSPLVPMDLPRGYSGRSQLSLGKRDSMNQLFSRNQYKSQLNNFPIPLNRNFSQDDFGGN